MTRSMRGGPLSLAQLVVGAALVLGCRDDHEPTATTSSTEAHEPPHSESSSADATAPTSAPSAVLPPPSASAPARAFDPRFVGRWTGTSSVYARVENDHQMYTRRDATLEVTKHGTWDMTVRKGKSDGHRFVDPERECSASGVLEQAEARLELRITASSCAGAPASTTARAKATWVGECRVQWDREEGTLPYEVAQMAFRKEGCR